jgi:flagellar hook-length control protein FliK
MPTPVNNLLPRAESPTLVTAAPRAEAARPQDFQKDLKRQTRAGTPEISHSQSKRPPKAKQVKRPARARREEPEVIADCDVAEPAGEVESNTAAAKPTQDAAATAPPADGKAPSEAKAAAPDAGLPTVAPSPAPAAADSPAADAEPGDPEVSTATATAAEVLYPPTLPGARDAQSEDEPAAPDPRAAAIRGARAPFDAAVNEPDCDAASDASEPLRVTDAAAAPADLEPVPAQGSPGEALDEPVAKSLATPSVSSTAVASAPADARPAHHPASPAPAPPEAQFAAANHETIVTSMRAEVLPNGGSMRIRLDPPQLGALQVTVRIQDGLVTAAFETSTDEATRVLGHSLNQLKTLLESHGVAVDRLQVQQAPRETQTSARNESQQQDQRGGHSPDQEHAARQEQQRREMLRRMWRRLSGEPDPLDLTA